MVLLFCIAFLLVNKKYLTTLLVRANENKNILLDVISKTSNTDITIQSINSISNSTNEYLFEITVDVDTKETLTKFINEIDSIPRIISVERIIK